MSDSDKDYLRRCEEQNICPACQKPIEKRFGKGQFDKGVFCSQDCYAKWHGPSLIGDHLDRLKKGKSDE